MRNKIVCLFLFLFLFTLSVFSQQNSLLKPVFHSIEQVALVNGDDAVSGALQTVNGFGLGNWYAGLGAGIDFYRYRSVPLFLDVRRSFNVRKGNKLFVYGDGGYNLPWVKHNEPEYTIWGWPSNVKYQYKGGVYWDAGFGYAVQIKNGNAFLLSAGFSHKYFSEKRTTTSVGTEDNQITDIQRFTYSLNRLMVKLGWQF